METTFPYCKRRKAGQGLGTRLDHCCMSRIWEHLGFQPACTSSGYPMTTRAVELKCNNSVMLSGWFCCYYAIWLIATPFGCGHRGVRVRVREVSKCNWVLWWVRLQCCKVYPITFFRNAHTLTRTYPHTPLSAGPGHSPFRPAHPSHISTTERHWVHVWVPGRLGRQHPISSWTQLLHYSQLWWFSLRTGRFRKYVFRRRNRSPMYQPTSCGSDSAKLTKTEHI